MDLNFSLTKSHTNGSFVLDFLERERRLVVGFWYVLLLLSFFDFYYLEIVSLAVVLSFDIVFLRPAYRRYFIEWFDPNISYFNPVTSSFFVFSFGLNFIFFKPKHYFFCCYSLLRLFYFLFFCFFKNYSNFFYPE